jgi:RNA polymerase sigma-70 factor (ECF subfamily)
MLVPEELIKRASDGDQQAFNEVALAYSKRVRATIDRIAAGSEQTANISETVFLRLYSSLHELNSVQSFEPWLYRLTVNAAYDFLRNERRNR